MSGLLTCCCPSVARLAGSLTHRSASVGCWSNKPSQLRFDRASLRPKNILSEQKADRFTLCKQSVAGKLGAATGFDKSHGRSINSAAA
ncbi:MAG: hypothetical protein HC895_02750 [Leptolyngbyaceae cyanobacterium SM1_3_5]|nr:hypothetical protein [Leptolyngbyaceae cyanobacterium SM1_3_5]